LCDDQNCLRVTAGWLGTRLERGSVKSPSAAIAVTVWISIAKLFEEFAQSLSLLCVQGDFSAFGLCLKGFLSVFWWLYLDENRDSREHLRTTVISIYELDLHVFLTGARGTHLRKWVLSEEQMFFLPASFCNRSKCALKIPSLCLKQWI